jgi:hypothetical protein
MNLDDPLEPLNPDEISTRACVCLWSAVLHKHLSDAAFDGEMFTGGKTAKLQNQYRYQHEVKIQVRDEAREWLKSEHAAAVSEMANFDSGYVAEQVRQLEILDWPKPLKRPMLASKQ